MKNACPSAITHVLTLNKYSHLGVNKYLTPSIAPGKVNDLKANNIKIIKSNGIIILFAFSIPFVTPIITIIRAINIAIAFHNIVSLLPAKLLKKLSISILFISPVVLKVKYLIIQPTTTL